MHKKGVFHTLPDLLKFLFFFSEIFLGLGQDSLFQIQIKITSFLMFKIYKLATTVHLPIYTKHGYQCVCINKHKYLQKCVPLPSPSIVLRMHCRMLVCLFGPKNSESIACLSNTVNNMHIPDEEDGQTHKCTPQFFREGTIWKTNKQTTNVRQGRAMLYTHLASSFSHCQSRRGARACARACQHRLRVGQSPPEKKRCPAQAHRTCRPEPPPRHRIHHGLQDPTSALF